MSRHQARAKILAMLDGVELRRLADATCDRLQAEEEARCRGPSFSVHTMQQQRPIHEGHLEYYERRARQAKAQADAHRGETYDNDLDRWQRDPGDENDYADHVPQMVRELEGDDVIEALCGPMGKRT